MTSAGFLCRFGHNLRFREGHVFWGYSRPQHAPHSHVSLAVRTPHVRCPHLGIHLSSHIKTSLSSGGGGTDAEDRVRGSQPSRQVTSQDQASTVQNSVILSFLISVTYSIKKSPTNLTYQLMAFSFPTSPSSVSHEHWAFGHV